MVEGEATAAATTEVAAPSAEEARGWVGHQVDDISGESVGRVDRVLADAEARSVEWIVVRAGRFGQRALVPARHAVAAIGRVWVPYSREAIRRAPRIDGSRGLTRDAEEQLLFHYGVAAQAGRAGEIAGREGPAVTATPVG